MESEINRIYGNRVRVRVCGLCWQNGKLLMVKHSGLNNLDFWAPPGGGVDFGKTLIETLVTEYQEECGISIEPGRLLFTCEFIQPPLHAIELFFEVFYTSGEVRKGFDPEMLPDQQIITDVKWMSSEEIAALPNESIHGIFQRCSSPEELLKMTGNWRI